MPVLLPPLNCLRPKPKNYELQITTAHGKEQIAKLTGQLTAAGCEVGKARRRRRTMEGALWKMEEPLVLQMKKAMEEGCGNIRGEAEDRRKEGRWRESSRNRLRKFLRRRLTVQSRSCGECLKPSMTCNCQWALFIPLFCFV
jgi:hypothetical protein